MLNKKCLFTHFTFFRNSSFLLNSISFTTVTNKEKRKTKEGNGIDQEEERCKKQEKQNMYRICLMWLITSVYRKLSIQQIS